MNSIQGFEKIATNCDILIKIFEKLNVEDHMRLSQVNSTLRQFYKSFILPKQYRCLKIFSTFSNGVVISNETDINRKLLRHKDLQEFISLYGKNVRELSVDVPMNFIPFVNVVNLQCDGLYFNMEIVELVATQLPHLERFQVKNFIYYERHFEQSHMESIQKLKNLRELKLDFSNYHSDATIKYQHFRKLVGMPKMESLKLSFVIEADNEEEDPITSLNSLNELFIQVSLRNVPSVLEIFRNLKSLSLRLPRRDKMDENTLNLIAIYCHNLQYLCLNDITFSNIQIFLIPQSVQELEVYSCKGLTYRNLQQILTQNTNLKKFRTQLSDYAGIFENGRISEAIETLELERVNLNAITMAYNHNESLRTLIWSTCSMWGDRQIEVMASFKNLQTLTMENFRMSLDILQELTHLRTLKIEFVIPVDWPEIIRLLKHPTLDNVDLQFERIRQQLFFNPITQGPDCVDLQTKISQLTLRRRNSYDADANFWLDILQQNKNMKLTLYTLMTDYSNFRKVIYHDWFSQFSTSIYIHGVKIDCNELKSNYGKIVRDLKIIPQSHKEDNSGLVLEDVIPTLSKNFIQLNLQN